MSASPLDNVLDGQLINPPLESVAVLDSIDHGAPLPYFGRGVASASELVRGWCRTTLFKPAYRPAPDVPFVPFPKEAGRFDVVRARYVVRLGFPPSTETEIEVASSRDVASIVATTTAEENALVCGERIRLVAARILDTTSPLDLIETGRSGDLVYGTPRAPTPENAPKPWHEFWERDLRWWCAGERVGFVFLKGDGGLSQVSISFAPEDNKVWFANYAWWDRRDK